MNQSVFHGMSTGFCCRCSVTFSQETNFSESFWTWLVPPGEGIPPNGGENVRESYPKMAVIIQVRFCFKLPRSVFLLLLVPGSIMLIDFWESFD